MKKKQKRPPNPNERDKWISYLTPANLDQMQEEAKQLFASYAEDHKDEIAVERALGTGIFSKMEELGSDIVSAVRSSNSFWKQLRLAVTTSILSPIICGALLAIALAYSTYAPLWQDFENKIHNMFVANAKQAPTN